MDTASIIVFFLATALIVEQHQNNQSFLKDMKAIHEFPFEINSNRNKAKSSSVQKHSHLQQTCK